MIQQLKVLFYKRFKTSFSKAGEDIQLWQLLKKQSGFFIDIGAHHPVYGNNSYFFYLRGWRGICIDPNDSFVKLYRGIRPEDMFLPFGIGQSNATKNYFELDSDQRNTFSVNYLDTFDLHDHVVNKKNVEVFSLEYLWGKYDLNAKKIDFMSIDVEGAELEVLLGNNWEIIRPTYILCESHLTLQEDLNSDLYKFFMENDYELVGKNMQGWQVGTLFFRDKLYHG